MNVQRTSIRPFLVGGAWRESSARVPIINPYDGETLADVCQAGAPDVEDAIQSAWAAFRSFRRWASHQRAKALAAVADSLTARKEEFAHTICRESGKPITDSRREVDRAIQTFTLASEETQRVLGEVIPLDRSPGMESYQGILKLFPIGPVLGITPFNFPLNLVAHKVAPCLAVGNPIVIKPAPQTPLTALLLGEVLMETELPKGTVSILPCDNQLAEQMVGDPRFQALSFTGSEMVGWKLKTKAGKKRVLLELGGNASVIIEPDAQVDRAVQRCLTGGYSYSGQTCISVQRIFAHQSIYQTFVESFVRQVKALVGGAPMNDTTVLGPLINEAATQRVEEWTQEAVSHGAKILTGGQRQGSILAPTVLAEVTSAMKVSYQEVFGPVVTVTPYETFAQAIDLVNDSPFGLQAGVFTQDINTIYQAYAQLDVGAVLVNESPTFRAEHMPYGGVKDSGIGREGVRYAMKELSEPKLLVLNLQQ